MDKGAVHPGHWDGCGVPGDEFDGRPFGEVDKRTGLDDFVSADWNTGAVYRRVELCRWSSTQPMTTNDEIWCCGWPTLQSRHAEHLSCSWYQPSIDRAWVSWRGR